MVFITSQEYHMREKRPPGTGKPVDPDTIRWLRYFNAHVDYKHQIHN
jgi:hypothetical protein